MSDLFAGSSMAAFTRSSGSVTETTNGTHVDTAWVRTGLSISGSSGAYAESAHFTETAEIYYRGDWYQDTWGVPTTQGVLRFYDVDDTEQFRLNVSESGGVLTIQPQYNNSGLTNIGSTFQLSIDVRNTINVYINCAVSGSVVVLVNGEVKSSGTADLSGIDGIAYFRHYSSNVGIWSQMGVSTDSNVGDNYNAWYPTGNGADTAWTGDYTDVDETSLSDADFLSAASADLVETMTGTTVHSVSGYVIDSIIGAARAIRGASGPQNFQLALRSGGANYFSDTKALDIGYGPFIYAWDTDPADAGAWAAGDIASLQMGVKSIT